MFKCQNVTTVWLEYLPDARPGEPRLVPDGWHRRVHQGVGLDELQRVIWKLHGALKGRRRTVTRTAPGPETESAQRAKVTSSTPSVIISDNKAGDTIHLQFLTLFY